MDVRMIASFESEPTAMQMAKQARATTLSAVAHHLNCSEEAAGRYMAMRAQYMREALKRDSRVRAGKGYLSVKGEFLTNPNANDALMNLRYDRIPTTTKQVREVPEAVIEENCARLLNPTANAATTEAAYRKALKVLLRNFTGVWYEGIGLVTKERWVTSHAFMTALAK